MENLNHTGPRNVQGGASITLQAEAYLARLPEVAGGDLKAQLTDGMVLVSGLLCGDEHSVPTQETHRALAKLVLGRMQHITLEIARHPKQGGYPCFTS